jgi:uncharacterized protein (TIGR02246 family)
MTESAEATARAIVAELQARIDARDLDHLAAYWHDDAVLTGTSAYNQGAEVREYVAAVIAQDASLRWVLPRVDVFLDDGDTIGFGAHGEIVVTEGGTERRAEFRLSIVASRSGDGWRLRHFHGSIPSDW